MSQLQALVWFVSTSTGLVVVLAGGVYLAMRSYDHDAVPVRTRVVDEHRRDSEER
jgi:hypothetical protein